jgi:manganese transport protein
MIRLFEPIGGTGAAFLLIIGITGAGLSTVFPIVLIAPWLVADFTGKPRDLHSPLSRALILGALVFAFGSILLEQTPPLIMIFSQAFQAMILPAVAIPVFILMNQRNTMDLHMASRRMNAGLVAVIIFSLITTYIAIVSFF